MPFTPEQLRAAYDELFALLVHDQALDTDDEDQWHRVAVDNLLKHSVLLALADKRLKELGVAGGVEGLGR